MLQQYPLRPAPSSQAGVTLPLTGTRLGVLDIGSNSAQLQIVDLRHGAPPLPAYAVKNPVLLGEEIDENGCVSPVGVDRVTAAACAAMEAVRAHAVESLYVFATAAIRDAVNREEILDRVEQA